MTEKMIPKEALQELGSLEEAPAFLIYRLSRLLRHDLRKMLLAEGLDISPEQYFVLYRLYQKDGVPQSHLADSVLGDFPNMTRIIDGLEKKGLVKRTPDPNDRRKYMILLTDTGRMGMDGMKPAILQKRLSIFSAFADHEMETLLRLIHRIQSALIE